MAVHEFCVEHGTYWLGTHMHGLMTSELRVSGKARASYFVHIKSYVHESSNYMLIKVWVGRIIFHLTSDICVE